MMSRFDLIAQLKSYAAFGPLDQAAHAEILSFVEREPRAAERSTQEGHLTGSAWIVSARDDPPAVILLHHKKLNRWLQPGGHADGSFDIGRVALREAAEETGIGGLALESAEIFDCDRHRIPARGSEPEHWHYDIRFVVRAPRGASPVVNDESNEVRWVGLDDLQHYTNEESVLRMAQKGALRFWR